MHLIREFDSFGGLDFLFAGNHHTQLITLLPERFWVMKEIVWKFSNTKGFRFLYDSDLPSDALIY